MKIKRHKIEISTLNLYLYNILLLPFFLITILYPYYLTVGLPNITSFSLFIFEFDNNHWLIFALLLGIVIHELVHGLTWKIISGLTFNDIKFGFNIKSFTPFCHIKKVVRIHEYVGGTLSPLLILGFTPVIIAYLIESYELLIFGFFMTIISSGDILIILKLMKFDWQGAIKDHPTKPCYTVILFDN